MNDSSPSSLDRDGLYGHGREIGRVRKNHLDAIRVALKVFNGHELIDLRVYSLNKNGMVQPTKAGIAISPALIDEVIQLLVEARTTAVAAGWTVGHVAVISTAHEHDRAAE